MSKQNIWAPKGMTRSACTKIPYKGYEISVAMDDSCGTMHYFGRSDIRVWCDATGEDVSIKFYQSEDQYMLYGDAETLKHIFAVIDSFKE